MSDPDPYSDFLYLEDSVGCTGTLFGFLRHHFRNELQQRLLARGAHVSKLTFVEVADRDIQLLQQFEPFVGDERFDHAAVFFLAFAGNQGAGFHAIEHAGHVRVAGNQAFADAIAGKALGPRAAQNAQHVVLGAGETIGFH